MRPPRDKKARKRKQTVESVHSVHQHIVFHGDDGGYFPPCVAGSTNEVPGSLEKLEVLRRRVERGEHLWVAEDVDPDADS